MKKRWGIWILAVWLLLGVFSVEAMAADGGRAGAKRESEAFVCTWVNPMYPEAEIASPGEIEEAALPEDRAGAGGSALTMDGAARKLRQEMVNRSAMAVVYVQANNLSREEAANAVLDKAMSVDSKTAGREGDYIRWHLAGATMAASAHNLNGTVQYSIVYLMRFYTSKQQENQVTAKVERVLSSLGVSKKTNYGKVKAIYDYICKNVTYDYAGLNDSSTGKYTAYNALMNGRAVCQGYASLFYRMARDAGLQVRFIPGSSRSVPHAWNIVKLGKYYYNLDSTWDAGSRSYSFFLKSNNAFPDHARKIDYASAAFNRAYPMAAKSYSSSTAAYNISKASVSGLKTKAYTGKKITQSPTLRLGGSALKKDRDYTISYKNNVNVGTATVAFKGKGNYSGALKKTFKITLKKGNVYQAGAYKYRVTDIGASGKKGAVSLAGAVNKAISSVNVGGEVKIGGKTMNITAISANAFKNNKNLASVSIGKNVKRIGNQAFYGASRLRSIVIKGAKLSNVGEKTFFGIHKKASIRVKSGMRARYKALLKGKGQPKSVVIR